ncbi:MAG: RluA family pseudouridine synthase [Rhodocyclaceae bacterium]
MRFDAALAKILSEHSRSRLQEWIRDGRVSLNGAVMTDTRYRVVGGEALEVRPAQSDTELADAPEDIPLDVVFEDEHIIVVHKPAGLVVHPGSGNPAGTLQNALLAHDEQLRGLQRAGIVHRLDKDTSGLMVVARSLIAQTDLVRQLQARTVKRNYSAVVLGTPKLSGWIEASIARHPTQRTRMAVVEGGKEARTHYQVVEQFEKTALIECALDTGRTHQIRVHMTHIGHPLVGDPVYASKRAMPPGATGFGRQALHAFRLGLIHPVSRQSLQWEIPMAADMQVLIDTLRSLG